MANLSSEIRYNLVLAASSVMASIGGYSIAYRWLEALKKKRPERLPNTLDHLAMLAENRGLLNEAIAQLVEADQVDPGNAFRHFEMGLLYEKMGDALTRLKSNAPPRTPTGVQLPK